MYKYKLFQCNDDSTGPYDDGDDGYGVCDERMTNSQCDVMMNGRYGMVMVIMLWIPKNNPINDKVAMDKS